MTTQPVAIDKTTFASGTSIDIANVAMLISGVPGPQCEALNVAESNLMLRRQDFQIIEWSLQLLLSLSANIVLDDLARPPRQLSILWFCSSATLFPNKYNALRHFCQVYKSLWFEAPQWSTKFWVIKMYRTCVT